MSAKGGNTAISFTEQTEEAVKLTLAQRFGSGYHYVELSKDELIELLKAGNRALEDWPSKGS